MAGLIPQSFVDELLDRVDIVEVVDRRVALKKAGKSYKACCPFHNEKTPSFNVNADRQFYHCFGCGAGGNAIGFVMDFDNVDFPEAVDILAGSLGLEVPRDQSPAAGEARQKKQSLYDALQFAARYYQRALRQHPQREQAVNYLKQRGLSGEIARDFALGYAPPGWDNLLQAISEDESFKDQLELFENAGLLVKKDNGGYYDRFRQRVIFPIRDNRGRIIAFGGRVLGDDKPKYLNSPESSVFHKQRELYGLYEARRQNAQLDTLVLVEGYMDVVSLFQYGVNCAVATLGTASSHYHLEKIFRHSARLVVCFDGDAAGQQAAERLLETALPAMQDGREIAFLFLPEGEDPDTFVRDKGKEAFLHSLATAKPLEDFLFELGQHSISLDSDAGKARYASHMLQQLCKLPGGLFRDSQLRKLASLTGGSIDALQSQLASAEASARDSQRARATGSADTAPGPSTGPSHESENSSPVAADNTSDEVTAEPSPTALPPAVELALSTLLHFPELASQAALPTSLQAEEHSEHSLIQLHSFIRETETSRGSTPSSYQLFGHWHGTPMGRLLARCAAMYSEPESAEIAQQQLRDALAVIEQEQHDAPLQDFIGQLSNKSPSQLDPAEREKLLQLGKKPRAGEHNEPS